jgi:hypothetical protein
MNQSKELREQIIAQLNGGNAHITFDDFVKDFPVEKCGDRIEGLPYTAWQVLEHMRIALWDILEFSRNANHVSPKWPEGYWPKSSDTGNAELWAESVKQFSELSREMEKLVNDPTTDLFAPIPHGAGQTILREALLVADHNSYHLGVLLAMSRLLKG